MSSKYDLDVKQYRRYEAEPGYPSPTRKTAIKHLMASEDNPLGKSIGSRGVGT